MNPATETFCPLIVGVRLPLRLVSLTNQREHWAKRSRRAKEQRTIAALALRRWVAGREMDLPLEIAVLRIAPRRLDSDNLQSACKHVRDGIADALGIDDGDARLTWHYGQASHGPEYAVSIEVAYRGTPAISKRMAS
jgi:crossover junction endodeoxyribonuclease RusA